MSQKEKKRAYYLAHREAIKARVKEYAARNRDKIKASNRKKYIENKESYLAKSKIQRETQPEKMLEYKRVWRQRHGEELRLRERAYRIANKERISAIRKQWVENNRDRKAASNKAWAAANPEKMAAITAQAVHRRRAVKLGCSHSEAKAITAWIRQWKSRSEVRCYWCGKTVKPSGCHVDHIIPIIRGGSHSTSNLCISCAGCNQRKSAKSVLEWNKHLQQPVLL